MNHITLETSINKLPRVGVLYTKKLQRLGIRKVGDFIYHFPHRYDDLSNVSRIADLEIDKKATIKGIILDIKNRRAFRRRMNITEAIIQDNSGIIKAVWFNQPYLEDALRKGSSVCLSGKVSLGRDTIVLSNPVYEIIAWDGHNENATRYKGIHTGRLVPIYPETQGVSSRWIRYQMHYLKPVIKKITEYLPGKVIKSQNLLALKDALMQIHFPDSEDSIKQAKKRLAFDELFIIQLYVLKQKSANKEKKSIPVKFSRDLVKTFVKSLPFKLTNAQRKSAWEILQDLEKPSPMNRLLEGDVGSGKTIVASIAALEVSSSGYQVAFMAPTEILARQHFEIITNVLKEFSVTVGLLTSNESKIFKKKASKIKKADFIKKAEKGEISILIGTHALIQKDVKFSNLAFVIIDEQHRFGVEQRAKLLDFKDKIKKVAPHLLSMTATPIPRTLSLTIYGDLDISRLDEMPKGRQKIITELVAPANREDAYQFVRNEIKKGRQAFVICPRIEVSKSPVKTEWSDVKAVEEEYEKLHKHIFSDFNIAMLHGKMKAKEKEEIMKKFSKGKLDLLVATSVVEVGIDIPNATVMIIEGAERFGLAQLHQFRGRVGRGKHQSYCLLFTDSPAKNTSRRLKALLSCDNGFELAEKDLEIRGPGDFYGIRQSGFPDLAMASLSDLEMIRKARKEGELLLKEDNKLLEYPQLSEKLKEFKEAIHLE